MNNLIKHRGPDDEGYLIFKDIYKLEPGWFMVVQYGNEELTINKSQYWDLNYSTDTVHDEKWFSSTDGDQEVF